VNAIQVLVQTIEEERYEFLGVVLLVAAELWSETL